MHSNLLRRQTLIRLMEIRMESLCAFASLFMVLWCQCTGDQPQTPGPPQMPQIPETYTTVQTVIQLVGLTESVKNIVVYRNYEAGKQLVISSINGNDSLGGVDILTRVDLRRKFQYFLPYEYCFQTSGSGVIIDKVWNWTANSTYKEQRIFGRQIVNVWTYEEQDFNVQHQVGVLLGDAKTPAFYFKADKKAQSATLVTFEKFIAQPPEDFLFDVPQPCQIGL